MEKCKRLGNYVVEMKGADMQEVELKPCPFCGTHNEVIKKRRNTVYSDIVYCWHCGQALKIFRSHEE